MLLIHGHDVPKYTGDIHREAVGEEPVKHAVTRYSSDVSGQLLSVLHHQGIKSAQYAGKTEADRVVQYEFLVNANISTSKVIGEVSRVLGMDAKTIVFMDSVPGKPNVAAIQVPKPNFEPVLIDQVIQSETYQQSDAALKIALGNSMGKPFIVDLAKMPHLLVAGTTGSGKSVAINTILLSLLYQHGPEALNLVLIDPKQVELIEYNGLPHLRKRGMVSDVITDMRDAENALEECVREMEDRYSMFAQNRVKNITGYNRIAEIKLPYIVVVVDEFADMSMICGASVEQHIARLGQKARAAGIHLILATQRPSVDVITGLIKSNIPTRIAFQVSAKVDSRTIIDGSGAEQLLGLGDGLYCPAGQPPTRFQSSFVEDDDISGRINEIKRKYS